MWSSVTARNKVLLTRSFSSSFTWTSQARYDIETSCPLTRKKESSFLTKIKLIEIFRNSCPNYVLGGVFSDPFKQLDHKIPDYILAEYMVLHKTLNSLNYSMMNFNLKFTGKILVNYIKIISIIRNSMVKLFFESTSNIFRFFFFFRFFWQLEFHSCSLSFIQGTWKYSHFERHWPWLIVEMACLAEVEDMHRNYFAEPTFLNENVPENYRFSLAV